MLLSLGILAAVGATAVITVLFTVWSNASISISLVYRGLTYAALTAGNWFAFGASNTGGTTTTYRYSTNGTNWSSGTMPAAKRWLRSATNGSRIVVFELNGGDFAYTDDGTTWTSGTVVGSSGVTDNMWDGSRFLACHSHGLGYSTTGASWTVIDWGWTPTTVALAGTTYIALRSGSSSSTAYICTSDPTSTGNWSAITLPAARQWSSLAYANGIWVAIAGGVTGYATSTNGTTWTGRTLPYTPTDYAQDARIAGWGGAFYYYSGGNDNVVYSTDGINWTIDSVGAINSQTVTAWAWNGVDKMLGIGAVNSTSGSSTYMTGTP